MNVWWAEVAPSAVRRNAARVLEYKYVSYHPGNRDHEKQAEAITEEMNRWVTNGWRIFTVLRPSLIGPVQLVLERGDA